jgi:biotin carboxylase
MKALVLAGGYPQIALIGELKKRGYTVVLADWNENPVARPYADIYYRESTLDVDAIRRVAQTEQVDFLITACTDQALLTVAKVSQDLGLPCYIDYQTALNVTNKSYMKEMFRTHCIPTARFEVMAELDPERISWVEYPVIVKPVDCNSSKGVKKVACFEELEEAFRDAVAMSRTGTAIVEDYVSGEELSVDVYVEDGVAHILCVSNSEKIDADDKFVIFRCKYPAVASEEVLEEIQKTAQGIADAFGIRNAPMLIQVICDGKGIYVLEFSARTGGGVKFQLIKRVSGFDVIGAVVDLTMGQKPHVVLSEPENNYISNEFIYCTAGEFDHLEGFEELKQQGVLSEYFVFKWKGAQFDNRVENSGDRVGGFTIQADTLEELIQKHNLVANTIRVLDSCGNDMMRHDLLVPLSYTR